MTKREFMQAVIAIENVNEEVKAFAEAEIAKLDSTNDARRAKNSAKHEENVAMAKRVIEEFLTDAPLTATEIGEVMGISTQKASALMRVPEVQDMIVKTDVKVKGKGKVKGYAKA